MLQQLGDVVNIVNLAVRAAFHPLAVAMTAQVWGNDVVVVPKVLCDPVPVTAMVSATVN